MRRLLPLVIVSLFSIATSAAVRHPTRFHWKSIFCAGATVDVFLSVAWSQCLDAQGQRYSAIYSGGGWGGIVAVSAFTFTAHLKNDHDIDGRYTGSSTSLALKYGAGAGVFKRNDGDGWQPSPRSEEYVLWLAAHYGYAADVSALTLKIVKHDHLPVPASAGEAPVVR